MQLESTEAAAQLGELDSQAQAAGGKPPAKAKRKPVRRGKSMDRWAMHMLTHMTVVAFEGDQLTCQHMLMTVM